MGSAVEPGLMRLSNFSEQQAARHCNRQHEKNSQTFGGFSDLHVLDQCDSVILKNLTANTVDNPGTTVVHSIKACKASPSFRSANYRTIPLLQSDTASGDALQHEGATIKLLSEKKVMNQRVQLLMPFILAALLSVVPAAYAQGAGIFVDADLKLGEQLIAEHRCAACHARKVGGDGTAIYRPTGRINAAGFLRGMVEQCNSELRLQLFPEEVTAIAAVLNRDHYRFK